MGGWNSEEDRQKAIDVGLNPDSQSQEVIVDTHNPDNPYGPKYKPEFCEIATEILSSGPFKTKAHLCQAFHCSKPTIVSWIKNKPEFKAAVDKGLSIGEAQFREKAAENAFKPTATVNNGLIKLLAANVYGIKEEPQAVVNVVQNNTVNSEEELKKRGIPIPKLEVEDVEE